MAEQKTLSHTTRSWALRGTVGITLLAAGTGIAAAQEAEPNDFIPAPAGTNLAIGYYLYAHDTDYNIAGGGTVKGSGLEVNLAIARYVHYTTFFGMPAGYQIFEAFGSEGNAHIGGQSLGNTFGASNPVLSAFFWPYANPAAKQYLIVAGFINPPFGSYDKNAALNVASAFSGSIGWAGDVQVGWDQGIGDHFTYDLGVDTYFFGDTTSGGATFTKDPTTRLQAWANWSFNPTYQASIGWESSFGGTQYLEGVADGTKSEFERIRVAGKAMLAPNMQVLLELNHDFVHVGGFKQAFGATARFVYIF